MLEQSRLKFPELCNKHGNSASTSGYILQHDKQRNARQSGANQTRDPIEYSQFWLDTVWCFNEFSYRRFNFLTMLIVD